MRLKTDFPRDEPLILHILFPLHQLIALLPISKFKLSVTENPWGCLCQEPALEMGTKRKSRNENRSMQGNIECLAKADF